MRLVAGLLISFALATPACAQPRQPQRFGVNLSGCTFTDTTVLCPSYADIDRYLALGFNLVRLPVKDVHLVDPAHRKRIAAVVRYIQNKGVPVILDRHDYKRHSAAEALAFWKPVLADFSSETLIELANEPVKNYPPGTNVWMVSAQDTKETVALFRANRITNPLLFGWPGYNAIFRADKGERRISPAASILTAIDRVGGIKDPLGRTFLSGHRYLDKGSSGTSAECSEPPSSDGGVAAFAAALRKRGMKAYITEFAFGSFRGVPVSCKRPGANMMRAIRANSDVILGTTAWGGGRAWKNSYIFKIEPPKGARSADGGTAYIESLAGRR